MAADGRIVIDTAINTKGFKVGAKEVEDAAKRAAQTIEDIGKTAQDSVNGAVEVINSQAEAFEKVDQQI
jgi:methyl-accepting chemotaxis protein